MLRLTALASSLLLFSSAACSSGTSGGSGGGGGGCPDTPFLDIPQNYTLLVHDQINFFALDDTSIYAVTASSSLMTIPKTGAGETMLAQGFGYESLSAAGPSVFLTAVENDVVLRVAKDGSSQTVIATNQMGSASPGQGAVAADDAHVYWLGEGQLPTIGATPSMGFLRRSDPDGGKVVDLATGLKVPTSVFVGGGFVYWAEQGSIGFNPAAPPDGAVRRVPVAGGAVETLASGLSGPVVRARRDGFVWFSSGADLHRVAESGGAPALMVKSGGVAVVGASAVYWLETAGPHTVLLRSPLAGGCPAPIALVDGATGALAIDAQNVYLNLTNTLVSVPQ